MCDWRPDGSLSGDVTTEFVLEAKLYLGRSSFSLRVGGGGTEVSMMLKFNPSIIISI